MPPRYNRDIEEKLVKKFKFERLQKSEDHKWYQLQLPDVPKIVTKFSHTKEHIGPLLWKKIAQQLRVRANYLDGMIDCKHSEDAYHSQVKTDPYPPWPDFKDKPK